MTWNVQWFCGLDDVVSVVRVVEHARAFADFDILCLQEVAVKYPALTGGVHHDQAVQLRELLPGFDVFFSAAVNERGRDGKWQRFGNLIATRLPATQYHAHALPYPADGGVRSMPRVAASVTVNAESGPLRIMTTHLEFYSRTQRLAQIAALRGLHTEASAHARKPPLLDETGSPFQSKAHTDRCIVTGDFNFEPDSEEYVQMKAPFTDGAPRFHDAWTIANGAAKHEPTFRVFDRRYGPEPITCDYIYVTDNLAPLVKAVRVESNTKASDHQPVLLEINC